MSHVSNNNGSIRNNRPHCPYKTPQGAVSATLSAKLDITTAPAEKKRSFSPRQRQWKKDESILKKIEQELSKKRQSRISTNQVIFRPGKRIKGTVSALGLSPVLAVGKKSLVLEAAQWMMVKKHNCVIVIDKQGYPCGIITAKDITYKLVACHLSARSTTVADIMDRNPVCVASTTPEHVAIDLMITRGAHQAIVHSKDGNVSGMLDITKYLPTLITRMGKDYVSEKMKQCTSCLHNCTATWCDNAVHPTLLAASKHYQKSKFVRVSIRDQVRNVIDMMKADWTTVALVYDDCHLAGIFTPKDVVLRVVAGEITIENCSMVRIMTPQPDVATFTISILDALKMMNDGCFKHMPIMDKNGDIADIVDIMELIQLFRVHHTWLCSNKGADSSCVTTAYDDHDNTADSGFSSPMLLHETPILRLAGSSWNSSSQQPEIISSNITSNQETLLTQNIFSFKFSVGSTTHRINWDYRDFSGLQAVIRQRVIASWQYSATTTYPRSSSIAIVYCDNEGDEILMTCDADLMDAVQMAGKMGQDRVRLTIYTSTTQEPEITFNDYDDITLFTQMSQQHQRDAQSMKHLTAQASAPTHTCSSATTLGEEAFGYPSCTTVVTALSIDDQAPKQEDVSTDGIMKRHKSQEHVEQDTTHSQWIADHLLLPTTLSFLSVAIISVFSTP